ncbi:MAG: PD40 domain-containing protein [Acidobacteria bacterium]|nr:PD40 domain-containing protein [Acidobacteriota bacterium]
MLAYAPAGAGLGTHLAWMDLEENVELVFDEWKRFLSPRLSPGQQQIAVVINDGGNTDAWTLDVGSGALNQLTTTGDVSSVIWTPDGTWITFGSRTSGAFVIQTVLADGSSDPETLLESEHQIWPEAWHPDGKRLIFRQNSTSSDVFIFDVEDESQTPLLDGAFDEYSAALSNDGMTLAYVSEKGGSPKVYITAFPEAAGETPVSTGEAYNPVWSYNDDRLIYREGQLWSFIAVTVLGGRVSTRSPLFDGTQIWWGVDRAHFDVHPDGERFLVLHMGEPSEHPKINIILNWFEELKQRVPTGR